MPDLPCAGRRIAFSFPTEPASIADARHLIVNEACTLPFSEDAIDDIALAVSEVLTNLVQHAHGYRIRGSCDLRARELEIRFEVDPDAATFLHATGFPQGLSYGGRGIPLLHALIPIIDLHAQGNGRMELRLLKPVPSKSQA